MFREGLRGCDSLGLLDIPYRSARAAAILQRAEQEANADADQPQTSPKEPELPQYVTS
jgi:hypothetical protein